MIYTGIRNANIVLDNIDNKNFSNEFKTEMTAEAKAIRGYSYALLYSMWGSTPIFTTTDTNNFKLPRATDEEMKNRIEQDLSEATTVLPVEQAQYGRITKGGALGILCK
jgi:hypothetical protein